MDTATVSIRDLRAGLSRYLRLVKSGAVIVITERGRPIGRLLPYDDDEDEGMIDFVRSGLAAWNGQSLGVHEPVAAVRGKKPVSDILVEDRGR